MSDTERQKGNKYVFVEDLNSIYNILPSVRTFMSTVITKVTLDVLKPHKPKIDTITLMLCKSGGVERQIYW